MMDGECATLKICVVVVLYNTTLHDSISVNSIVKVVNNNPKLKNIYSFVLINNGPESIRDKDNDSLFIIVNNRINSLSYAYNLALIKAEEFDSDWFLLMDQDTLINEEFLEKLAHDSEKLISDSRVVCIVPTILDGEMQISPSRRFPGGVHRPLRTHKDYVSGEVYAVGSCSLIRMNFLRELKGFNQKYVVDSVDRWLFKEISIHNKLIYRIKTRIRHNLSVRNYKELSEDRYKNIINSELEFIKQYYSIFDRFFYTIRIVFRGLKIYFFKKNKIMAKVTFNHIKDIFN